jgi:deoxyribodipyrimidine photo-lyase
MRRLLESNSTTLSLPSGFHTERVKWLYDGLATSSSKNGATNEHLLYWMQTSVRSKYNYALEYAIAAANALTLPLHVVYFLSDQSIVPKGSKDPNSFGFATERHAKFGLEGLEAVQKKLHKRGLSFSVFHHSHALKLSRIEMLDKCAENAALVVTDRPYLRPWCQDLEQCVEQAKKKSHKWGLVQVEGDIVVPCESASPKEEYAARTIRPKITNQLSKYLVVLEHVEVQRKCQTADDGSKFLSSKHPGLKLLNVMDIKEVLATLQLDHSVPGVNCFIGGEKKAVEIAKHFLEKKLARYADDRNEPAGDGGSNLSLYLRYGHISPVRIALAAQKMKNCKAGRDSFLEEMIIRRELSINMAVYNGNYDNFDCLPEFAIITLRLHKEDKRPHLYTLEELEQGKTYDAYWNAAQQEVVQTGKVRKKNFYSNILETFFS